MKTKRLIMVLSLGLGLTLGLVWLLVSGHTVSHAFSYTAGFTVDVTTDENDGMCAPSDCSLREAITAANSNGQADTITLGPATYTLTLTGSSEDYNNAGDLDIITDTAALTITGLGPAQTVINAGGIDRVFHIHTGTVVISGVTIMNGAASQGGGIENKSSLTLVNVMVVSNTAEFFGGGVYVEDGDTTMTNTQLISNIVYYSCGGGMYIDKGNVTLADTHILSNTAQCGGGMSTGFGQVTVIAEGGEIRNNTAAGDGGGVIIQDSGSVMTLSGTHLINNSAHAYGGGIYVSSGHATLSAVQILSNTVDFIGSGACVGSGALTITDNSLVAYNRSTDPDPGYGGGGLGVDALDASLRVFGGQIFSNTASSGGGVFIGDDGGSATLSGVQIFSNTAGSLGGGASIRGSGVLTITDNSLVAYNRVTGSGTEDGGGGLAVNDPDALLRVIGGQIFSNTARSGGGGVFIGDDGGSASLERVAISNNSATDGAGINNYGTDTGSDGMLTIINSTISQNGAVGGGSGGGIYTGENATTVLTFTTVASNTATGGGPIGGGLHQAMTGATVLVQNCLVAYNSPRNCSPGITSTGYNLDSANTCGFTATGDITSTNPLLGPLTDDNGTQVHPLLDGSPAIDKGLCVAGITTDQRGQSRPTTGCDIGAYEVGGESVYLPVILKNP